LPLNRGRIANTAGDSVLAEFSSAVDAVQCAVEARLAEGSFASIPDRNIARLHYPISAQFGLLTDD
jgi:class 3 adenylate cyclase